MKDTNSMTVTVLLFIAIFVRGPSSINAVTNPDDASTLNSIYTTLNSPQQLTNWIANGGDPCAQAWKGITCSPDSRVTEIVIPNLGLSGSIGFQLASLTAVTNFDVSNNNFGNQIPYSLPPNVQQLNLAGCNFNGALPYSISQMVALNYLNVSHNQIQGNLPDNFASLTNLSTLDYSFNAMSGNLTPSMSSLTGLHNLYLENNQFTGSLDVLANLSLQNLNVENNQFTGYIPEPLKSINLKTGGNPLNTGPAPPPPPGTPPAPPRRVNPTPKSNSNNGSSDKSSKSSIGIGAIIGIVLSVLLICAIIAFFILRRRSRKQTSDVEKFEMPPFVQTPKKEAFEVNSVQASSAASVQSYDSPTTVNLKPPPINKSFDDADITSKPIIPNKKINLSSINAKAYSIADLQMATESFNSENLIGEGSIGRVYRGQFDDGKVLAVKKINSFAIASPEDFLEIVSEISKLHHPNVTELNGYCSEYGQHLIVYEFHKNGSLHDFLHLSYEDSTPLIWNSRVKIALGSARALEYLHEVCSPSVVHKNFKSANILLDSELNPHLSDSGLASLVQDADQTGSGYSAPEVAMSGQYTIKSDVYSFGVVMLELLTGRKPFDSSKARSEQSLVRWATPQLHDIDALAKMVDPTLENLYPVKSLSRFADVIALCVQSEPEFRPPMSEVVEALVRLVQRANMSKRTAGNDLSPSLQNSDGQDNLMF